MPDDENRNNNPYDAHTKPHPEIRFYTPLFIVLFGGLVILWQMCSSIDNDKDFWTVFVGGSVSWLIFLAMIVQIRVSERQWEVMQQGLAQTRELFELTERPSLGLAEPLKLRRIADYNYVVEATVRNYGKNPAVGVKSQCIGYTFKREEVSEWGCPEPADYDAPESQSIVAVNSAVQLTTDAFNYPMFLGIKEFGEIVLFVWIKLTYFKPTRPDHAYTVEYYFRYDRKLNGFLVCPCHNDAT